MFRIGVHVHRPPGNMVITPVAWQSVHLIFFLCEGGGKPSWCRFNCNQDCPGILPWPFHVTTRWQRLQATDTNFERPTQANGPGMLIRSHERCKLTSTRYPHIESIQQPCCTNASRKFVAGVSTIHPRDLNQFLPLLWDMLGENIAKPSILFGSRRIGLKTCGMCGPCERMTKQQRSWGCSSS